MRGGFLARLSGEAAAAAARGRGGGGAGSRPRDHGARRRCCCRRPPRRRSGCAPRSRVEPALAGAVVAWIGADAVLVTPRLRPLPPLPAARGRAADRPGRGRAAARPARAADGARAASRRRRACSRWSSCTGRRRGRRSAEATWFARAERSLGRAVTAAGGPAAIRACGGATTLEAFRPYLAWRAGRGNHRRPARAPSSPSSSPIPAPRLRPPGRWPCTGRAPRCRVSRGPWRVLPGTAPPGGSGAGRPRRARGTGASARPAGQRADVRRRRARPRRCAEARVAPRERSNRRPRRGGGADRRARDRSGDAPGGLHRGHTSSPASPHRRSSASARDGRVFVAEKGGLVKVFDGLGTRHQRPSVVADLRTNVHDPRSSAACSALALDPRLPANPYLYVLYSYDHVLGSADPAAALGRARRHGRPVPVAVRRRTRTGASRARGSRASAWAPTARPGPSRCSSRTGAPSTPRTRSARSRSARTARCTPPRAMPRARRSRTTGSAAPPQQPVRRPPTAARHRARRRRPRRAGRCAPKDLRTPADPRHARRDDHPRGPGDGRRAARQTPGRQPRPERAPDRRPTAAQPVPHRVPAGTSELWLRTIGWGRWRRSTESPTPRRPASTNFGWPCYEGGAAGNARQPTWAALGLGLCEDLYADPAAVTAPFAA
jgi:hypothetical protein